MQEPRQPRLREVQPCPRCGEENPERFRLCGFCGAPLAAVAAREVRKTVTVVFSDLKDSTALGERLDSEALREVMSRYFEAMRAVLEAHGGLIEKFIGDAIMAVFGLPRVHEDDALRAVRAAFAMQAALAQLNGELEPRYGVRLSNRTGVNTGEVVSGDPSLGQRLVTGDTVNLAARLEQAAPANEVLLGQTTYRLVRAAVQVEPVAPLDLKGKSEPVPAYRLLGLVAAEPAAGGSEGLVGRERELDLLVEAFAQARTTGHAKLVLLVGEPGIGKSRLTRALADRLAGEARILRGRCLSYGNGISYWPLVEIVRAVAQVEESDPPELARTKLAALVPTLPEAAERVAAAVGLDERVFPLEEINWAVRKLLETLAQQQPLILLVDDVHWASEALLELLETVAANVEAPLLLVCASRPELEQRHEQFAAAALRLELAPLDAAASERMIAGYLGGALPARLCERVVAAAEGNPLYVEQLLSLLVDEQRIVRDGERWRARGSLTEMPLPDSVQALLAARLELLADGERQALETAAVIGQMFTPAALAHLLERAADGDLEALLTGLAEKRLLRRGERDGFQFGHILIRDTAYRGLLKRARAQLHERFADWAERRNRELDRDLEYEQILGYHLEQAHRCLGELGPLDEHGHSLGLRAAERLGSAGRRAFASGDANAAAQLLERAVCLLPDEARVRLGLTPLLAEALLEAGEFTRAETLLAEATAAANACGDEIVAADIQLTGLLVRHRSSDNLEAWRAEVERETNRIIPQLESESAAAVLAKAWRLVGFLHGTVCQWQATALAVGRALENARLAGDVRQEARLSAAYAQALCDGPTAVPAAIAESEAILARRLPDRQAEALVSLALASLQAMNGELDEARRAAAGARDLLDDLGAGALAAHVSLTSSRIELLAGAPAAALAELRRDYDTLGELGDTYFRPLVGALLCCLAAEQGSKAEVAALAVELEPQVSHDDVEALVQLRLAQARLSGGERELRQAEEALELLLATDALVMQADALCALAALQGRAGKKAHERLLLGQAYERYAAKGHLPGRSQAERALRLLGRDAHAGPLVRS